MIRPPCPTHPRPRRGVTLVETLVAATVGLLVLVAVTPFFRLNRFVWTTTLSDTDTQRAGLTAGHEIARHTRMARSVVLGASGATRLTLRLPRVASDGRLVVPLQDGDVVSYYSGNLQGTPVASGGYLWRSVNGAPDRAWSAPQGRGRTPLAGLEFTYFPPADPESVTFALRASDGATPARTFYSSQEVVLRNKRIGQ